MSILLTNAILFNLDPIGITRGGLRVVDGTITQTGPDVVPAPDEDTLDCHGAVVLPGLVNGHTHLYSALAAGMPPPPIAPKNFHEILQFVWWRLDRALDAESIETSARIGALDALRSGTTTLIDHHASPNAIDGSLDRIEQGIADVGLRAVLCYEITNRNGRAGADAGLAENGLYLTKCQDCGGDQFAALVGAHAAFTLTDKTLRECVDMAEEFDTGIHIHVAEDPCDDAICRAKYGAPLVERLASCGLLPGGASESVAAASILAHGTHLAPQDATRISGQIAALAHNPRSNMNNHVGYAPVGHMQNVLLGTDGIGGDMFTEARHAWFKARDAGASLAPNQIVDMLAHAARTAGRALGTTIGRLAPGAAADLVVTDYVPATPIQSDNAAAHLIFALGPRHVRHVAVAGQWVLKNSCP
ncbi:MAG: amidohydrolase family protein, partial [Phycisphaerae bacterium]